MAELFEMAKRERIKLTLSGTEMKALKVYCSEHYRFLPVATALRRIIVELCESTDANQEVGTAGVLGAHGCPRVTCPDPARVEAAEDLISSEKENSSADAISEAVKKFESLDWQGGELRKNQTSAAFFAVLCNEFSDLNVAYQVCRANDWTFENGKPRKKLSGWLSMWMEKAREKKETNGADQQPQQKIDFNTVGGERGFDE